MDSKDEDMFCDNDLTDLFDGKEFEMHDSSDSEDCLTTLISSLKSETVTQEQLKNVHTLVSARLSTISIIIVDDQLLKYLMPVLKDIYTNLVKEVHTVAQNNENLSHKVHVLQNYLQMCIIILQILDDTFDCILKNKQFSLCDVRNLPLNASEILLLAFRHCKESNTLHGGYRNQLKEMLTIFKVAHDIHEKLFTLLECVADVSEVVLLKNVLKFLVEIGDVLPYISLKANTNNWKGYVRIAQKFAQMLNEHSFSIEQPTFSLVEKVLQNLQLLNKDNNIQNDNSLIRLCNFYLKIVLKLCELFGSNTEDHWALIYKLLHTCYIYYPPFLTLKGYNEEIISNINTFIFSQVDLLLRQLCFQPRFHQIIENLQPVAQNTLLFYANTFKVMSQLVALDSDIVRFGKISAIIGVFFSMLEGGYCEFWDIILVTADNKNSLYDDTVLYLADIICALNEEQYNQVEHILFQSIFVQCPWCSLLAVDIWDAVLRKENQQLGYETICNIIEQSEFLLIDDHSNQPQLIFLKNLLQRLFENLSPNYRSMLLDKYPLYNNLHIWKVFGFKCFDKNEFVGIAAEIINVVHKTTGFISANCNLEDFKILCNGLDTVSFVPDRSEIDTSHLVLSLFRLWELILDLTSIDTYLFKYVLQKLIPATNNFLSHFNTAKLLRILNGLSQLLNSNLNIKIVTTSLLSTLTGGLPNVSLQPKQFFTPVNEIFHKLLTHKNPIINQNALEVFLNFNGNRQQRAIKGSEVEKRISNFINNKVEMGPLNTTEYFKMQAKYKYVHDCYVSASDSNNEVNSAELDTVVKRIKLDVELFHKLTNRTSDAEENLVKIMRILNH